MIRSLLSVMAESFLSYFSCLVLDTGGFKQLSPREAYHATATLSPLATVS